MHKYRHTTAILTLTLTLATSAAAQTCQGRLIEHAVGATCVPTQAKRVVVLDNGTLDNTLALGVKPVGAATVDATATFPGYLQDQVRGVATVGLIDEPSLERVMALKPDLILGSKDSHGQHYAQLSRIAPTVLKESLGATWKSDVLLTANALGRSARAHTLLNDYTRRARALRHSLGTNLPKTSVTLLRAMPSALRLYQQNSFSGQVLKDVGLPRPTPQNQKGFAVNISTEQLPLLEAHTLLVTERDPANSALRQAVTHPLWQQLRVVKQNRVFHVPHETWISGLGLQAANLMLGDLERLLQP